MKAEGGLPHLGLVECVAVPVGQRAQHDLCLCWGEWRCKPHQLCCLLGLPHSGSSEEQVGSLGHAEAAQPAHC